MKIDVGIKHKFMCSSQRQKGGIYSTPLIVPLQSTTNQAFKQEITNKQI